MFDNVFVLFALLFIKHWYVDFVNQTDEEVKYKGVYLDWRGIKHSFKHGVATFIIMFVFILDPFFAFFLGSIDFLVHYHVDYCKMRYGNRDITTKAFWNQLGLDQLAHYLTYLVLVWMLV